MSSFFTPLSQKLIEPTTKVIWQERAASDDVAPTLLVGKYDTHKGGSSKPPTKRRKIAAFDFVRSYLYGGIVCKLTGFRIALLFELYQAKHSIRALQIGRGGICQFRRNSENSTRKTGIFLRKSWITTMEADSVTDIRL